MSLADLNELRNKSEPKSWGALQIMQKLREIPPKKEWHHYFLIANDIIKNVSPDKKTNVETLLNNFLSNINNSTENFGQYFDELESNIYKLFPELDEFVEGYSGSNTDIVLKSSFNYFTQKYLPVKKKKIQDILGGNRGLLAMGNIEDYVHNVQKSINELVLNLVSMTSGGGSTFASLADKYLAGNIDLVELVGMIASKPNIGSIDKASERIIATHVLYGYKSKDPKVIKNLVKLFDADILFGNGWLPLIPREVIMEFIKNGGIILNQHDGPLRANHLDFGGKGMIGDRVVAARVLYLLETGASGEELFTESAIHVMTENFDEGYSIGVKKFDLRYFIEHYRNTLKILDNDAQKEVLLRNLISDVKQKLLAIEHENVGEVVKKIGKTKTIEQHPSYDELLVPNKNAGILEKAKRKAIEMYPNG